MECLLIYAREDMQPNRAFIERLCAQGEKNGLSVRPAAKDELLFHVPERRISVNGRPFSLPVCLINRTRDVVLSHMAHLMNIPVYNSYAVTALCSHKFLQLQYAAGCGVPVLPALYKLSGKYSWTAAEHLAPLISKPSQGHGGQGVTELAILAAQHPCLPAGGRLLQKKAGAAGKDLRVYVIGNQPVAAVMRTANHDFRANYSLGGSIAAHPLEEPILSLVSRLCSRLFFDYVGMDFLFESDGSPVFNEIEDAVGARMLYQTSDIDIAGMFMKYLASTLGADKAVPVTL